MADNLMTVAEAARYLGRHPQTIKYHVYTSKLLTGTRLYDRLLFTQAELDAFAQACPRPGRKEDPAEDSGITEVVVKRARGKGKHLARRVAVTPAPA